MKNLFSVLVIMMLFLVSCSGPSGNSSSNETHTHNDGTVHSDSDGPDHELQEDAPDGQESFKVDSTGAQQPHEEHQHAEEGGEHDHQH
ncbi:MAG: hypothetical protein R6U64_08495 [Bacteroidales bacterium]